MASSYVIPNVGQMDSTGLTDAQMETLLQALFLQCLGIDPEQDPNAFARVRIDWPTTGEPSWLITEDVLFLRVTEADEAYNVAHEQQEPTANDVVDLSFGSTGYGLESYGVPGGFTERTIYTRAWDVNLIFYGPNSFDRARQVKSCLFQDFVTDQLSASNLYEIPIIGTPRRAPELFQNQWWQRADFSFKLYEQVTDSLIKPGVNIVEVHIRDASGQGDDIVIEVPQQ